MTDAELDALESYLRGHGTIGPHAAAAIAQLRRELEEARALLKQAREDWVDDEYPIADKIDAALAKANHD